MKYIRDIARENLIKSKHKSKKYYDRFANPIDIKIGDKVWLLKEPKGKKLEKNQYLGPFEILKIYEKNNVDILIDGKIKTVNINKLFKI